jgi:lipoyl(octanoyl) transferase
MWSVYINRHSADHPFYFKDLIALQESVLEKLRSKGESAILFAELAPTLTLGARQIHQDPEAFDRFRQEGVDVVPGQRGGNETWHGPGQWVGFVLTPLHEFTGDPRGVRKAVHLMLDLLLPITQVYQERAHLEEDSRLGIWSDEGKLVSIGIKIRAGYTSSGFAMNCVPNPQAFLGVNPCGISDAKPDFLFRESIAFEEWDKEFQKIPLLIERAFTKKESS